MNLAVRPGEYELKASMTGYETMIQTQVIVEVDRTIIIDFNISPTDLTSAEVVLLAKGTHNEIGKAEGALLMDEIMKMVDATLYTMCWVYTLEKRE